MYKYLMSFKCCNSTALFLYTTVLLYIAEMAVIKKMGCFTHRCSMRITLNKCCVDAGPSSPLFIKAHVVCSLVLAIKKNPASYVSTAL